MVDRETFVQVAPWLAIAGNALLTPPLQAGAQSAAIFDARLWEELAACEDAEVANAVDKLVKYLDGREETAAASREAQTGVCILGARDGASNLDDRVQRASVEFAHLFVGPPKPARGRRFTASRVVPSGSARRLIRCARPCATTVWSWRRRVGSTRTIWASSFCWQANYAAEQVKARIGAQMQGVFPLLRAKARMRIRKTP